MFKRVVLAVSFLGLLICSAAAQAPVAPCTTQPPSAIGFGTVSCFPVTAAAPLPVTANVGTAGTATPAVPPGATPIASASTGTTGAVTASLAAAAGKFTYICGFQVSSLQGTTASNVVPTVATLIGGTTFTYQVNRPASVATLFSINLNPCIPASATNSAITVTAPADANAAAVDVNAWGYQF